MRGRIKLLPRKQPIPARQAHWVPACQHWCYCYAVGHHIPYEIAGIPHEGEECEDCARKARHKRNVEEYLKRGGNDAGQSTE